MAEIEWELVQGADAFIALGLDLERARALGRRFAYPCLDWSERQSLIAGALGAAILEGAVRSRWAVHEPDSRALRVTSYGRRQMSARFHRTPERFDGDVR